MKYGSEFTPKKRVTKNDKKKKRDVYSQKHIRLTLKQMEGKITNAPECKSTDREGLCSAEIRRMVGSQTGYVNCE